MDNEEFQLLLEQYQEDKRNKVRTWCNCCTVGQVSAPHVQKS